MKARTTPTYNLADLFELIVAAVPDREAFVCGDRRLTFAQLDRRANQLAHALGGKDITAGSHVGLQLHNGSEYIEAMLACFKLRAVPINVNYRYVADELRYLFTDADLQGLVVHQSFVPTVADVAPDCPDLNFFLVVDDDSTAAGDPVTLAGSAPYEATLASFPDDGDWGQRSSDDLYCVYTGGTTGMPKGVMWRHEDIFFAAMGGGDPLQFGDWISSPDELPDRILDFPAVALAIPPFMHASAHWLAMHQLFGGSRVVCTPGGRFDPEEIWDLVTAEAVTTIVVVGDAIARPLADALEASPDRWDTSSVMAIGSGGAILSPSTKDQLSRLLPAVFIVDAFGSSETGTVGSGSTIAGTGPSEGPRFQVNDETAVLDEQFQPVTPGSGQIGRLARSGHVPIGYYNDPEKTADTIVESDGRRWVLPGDFATVDDDGTVTLLGRGSISINTGGEKVFPEEVESALKGHPDVLDAVVIGVPDARWGERVVALLTSRSGELDSDAVADHCRQSIAGYKVPRDLIAVDEIVRSPAGKADYQWAKAHALTTLGIDSPDDPS
jgi:acyl-CoA synthetase (AMP-forming)/AMP-acid ligase II